MKEQSIEYSKDMDNYGERIVQQKRRYAYPWEVIICKLCEYHEDEEIINDEIDEKEQKENVLNILLSKNKNQFMSKHLAAWKLRTEWNKIMKSNGIGLKSPYVNRILFILNKFVDKKNDKQIQYNYLSLDGFLNELTDYSYHNIIDDFNEIIDNHFINENDMKFIKQQINHQNCNPIHCPFIASLYRDRNDNDIPVAAHKDIIDKIHCEIVHFDLFYQQHKDKNDMMQFIKQINAIKPLKQRFSVDCVADNKFCMNLKAFNDHENKDDDDDDEKSEKDMIQFQFGIFEKLIYHSMRPAHYSLKHEMLNNKIFKINELEWDHQLNKSNILMKTKFIKNLKSNGGTVYSNSIEYGILFGQPIGIEHILTILIYIKFNQICKNFRIEFFNKKNDYKLILQDRMQFFNLFWSIFILCY